MDKLMDTLNRLESISMESMDYIAQNSLASDVRGGGEHTTQWIVNRDLRSYESVLLFPFKEYVLSKTARIPPSDRFVALDIGCGSGAFLKGLESLDPKVIGYGITNVLFNNRPKFNSHDRNRIIVGDISSKNHGPVNVFCPLPDVPYVLPKIPDNSIDMITSSYTLMYLAEPELKNVVTHSSRMLAPGGIALLDVRDAYATDWINERFLNTLETPGCTVTPMYNRGIVKVLRLDKPAEPAE